MCVPAVSEPDPVPGGAVQDRSHYRRDWQWEDHSGRPAGLEPACKEGGRGGEWEGRGWAGEVVWSGRG